MNTTDTVPLGYGSEWHINTFVCNTANLTPIGIPIYPLCKLTVNHSIKGFQITHSKIRYSMYVCTNHSFSIIMKFSYANQLSQINQNKPICFSNTFRTNISNLETRIGVDRTNISFSFIVQIMHTCKYLTNFHNQSVQINM